MERYRLSTMPQNDEAKEYSIPPIGTYGKTIMERFNANLNTWEEINPYNNPDEHKKMKERFWKAIELGGLKDRANPPVELEILGLEETIEDDK